MTVERLKEANRVHDALEVAERDQLLFIRNKVEYEALHWKFPWKLFSDEEWEQMMATIKERTEKRVADLEAKFAAL